MGNVREEMRREESGGAKRRGEEEEEIEDQTFRCFALCCFVLLLIVNLCLDPRRVVLLIYIPISASAFSL